MYAQKTKWQKIRNSIIILPNGERIDLRKAAIGKVRVQKRAGANKYGARSARYDGSIYASTAEAKFAQELDYRKKAGEIKDWEKQLRMPLVVNGHKICTYIVDFLIHHNDGTKEYVEIKGLMLPLGALKIKLFEALYVDDAKGVKFTVIRS